MMSSKAKEEKISAISDPTTTRANSMSNKNLGYQCMEAKYAQNSALEKNWKGSYSNSGISH